MPLAFSVQVPGLELLDDFFGTAPKPAEAKVEKKPTQFDIVDEVLSLFGEQPTKKEPLLKPDVDPSELSMLDLFGESTKVDMDEPEEKSSNVELPSEWLANWQNDYKFDWRSDWALAIRKKLRSRINGRSTARRSRVRMPPRLRLRVCASQTPAITPWSSRTITAA